MVVSWWIVALLRCDVMSYFLYSVSSTADALKRIAEEEATEFKLVHLLKKLLDE